MDILNDSFGGAATLLPDHLPALSQPPVSSISPARDKPFPNHHDHHQSTSAASALSSQLVTTSLQFVSAQQGSGSSWFNSLNNLK
jgi:hypothetical protein